MSGKIRLDLALLEQGYAESREKAKALVMSGNVFIGAQRADKAGMPVSPDVSIEIKGTPLPYVSRGGLKLAKAISLYKIDLTGLTCMDIGASTGGFTDCMLQNGAQRVYAVDVGYGQLAWSLRNDVRVINMERTNIRHVTPETIDNISIDFASVDVSFISLKLVLPVLKRLLSPDGRALLLVKPQFEAGRDKVGKKGVVRELSTHVEVLFEIYSFLAGASLCLLEATYSPVKGPQGNIEYLYYIAREGESIPFAQVAQMAEESHERL